LGLDDWAGLRGNRYGTILVNLETHRVVDLLPDRTAATAEAWIRNHPEILFISRDRSSDYATAARLGAPQAWQVADRFHYKTRQKEDNSPSVSIYRRETIACPSSCVSEVRWMTVQP
jgi:transposase